MGFRIEGAAYSHQCVYIPPLHKSQPAGGIPTGEEAQEGELSRRRPRVEGYPGHGATRRGGGGSVVGQRSRARPPINDDADREMEKWTLKGKRRPMNSFVGPRPRGPGTPKGQMGGKYIASDRKHKRANNSMRPKHGGGGLVSGVYPGGLELLTGKG